MMGGSTVARIGPLILIGLSALTVLVIGIFGFGGSETQHNIQLDFGMQMDFLGGPAMKVWTRTPLPTFVEAVISNVSKKDPDGTVTLGVDMIELFPSGEDTNYGSAVAQFTLRMIDASEEPVLNTTMKMIPMLYRRDIKLGRIGTVFMIITAFMVPNWGIVIWVMILSSASLVIIGATLLVMEKKKQKETLVEEIFPTTED